MVAKLLILFELGKLMVVNIAKHRQKCDIFVKCMIYISIFDNLLLVIWKILLPLPLTIFCLANVFYSPSLPSPTIAKSKHSQINRTRPYMAIPISRLLYQRINYLTIIERMSSGRAQYIAKCKEEGVKMGRPSSYRKSDEKMREQYAKMIAPADNHHAACSSLNRLM